MMDFLDNFVLGPLNLIDRAEGLVRGLWYRDPGYRMAIPRSDKNGRHSLVEVEDVLKRYGVVMYGRTHDSENMHFSVKRRQARWAEYILLHAGVELVSPTFDRRNPGYAAKHTPGWMPTPWSERGQRTPDAKPGAAVPEPSPPLHQRLLRWLDS